MFTKSIRWRIQLWLAFLLLCVLSGFGVTVYQLYRLGYFDQLDEELSRRIAALSSDVRGRPFGDRGRPPFGERERGFRPGGPPPFERHEGGRPFEGGSGHGGPRPRPGDERFPPGGPDKGPGPRPIRLSPETQNLFDESDTNAFYYAVWSRGGTLIRVSSNAPPNLVPPGNASRDTRPHTLTRDRFRETYHFTEMGECILAGRWVADDLARLDRFGWLLLSAGAAVLALGLGGSWSLARGAVRPVEDISATASRISAGNLSERINVEETDGELGRLAGVLNSTFSRLETAFDQQKQFTADASHELRTPLAVMISEAQTTLARPRNASEYRETVETCLEAAQEMRRITDSLLQLARLDSDRQQIERGPVDLAAIAREALSMIRPLAEARKIQIEADLQSANTLGDASLLTQVITNLLNNAIHYNKESGEIRFQTRQESQFAEVSVSDTGRGISQEDLPHIFERFYRGDKSRSGGGGRMGLGLAICKTIIDLHRGTIAVSSEVGIGSRFVVTLPRIENTHPPA